MHSVETMVNDTGVIYAIERMLILGTNWTLTFGYAVQTGTCASLTIKRIVL